MNEFESNLNELLIDVFNQILRYEATEIQSASNMPVTVTEAHILDAIGKNDTQITVSEIAVALEIAVPTVTVALKKLIQKELVTKTPCEEDGRRMLVRLTPNGKRIFKTHCLFHQKMVRDIARQLTDVEKDTLLKSVKKITYFFKEKRGG